MIRIVKAPSYLLEPRDTPKHYAVQRKSLFLGTQYFDPRENEWESRMSTDTLLNYEDALEVLKVMKKGYEVVKVKKN